MVKEVEIFIFKTLSEFKKMFFIHPIGVRFKSPGLADVRRPTLGSRICTDG
jgi:hypothetical protein